MHSLLDLFKQVPKVSLLKLFCVKAFLLKVSQSKSHMNDFIRVVGIFPPYILFARIFDKKKGCKRSPIGLSGFRYS